MWLLGRVLPYLISGHVPMDDTHWQNYPQLLHIIDLFMAQEISVDEVGELTVLIQEHHAMFVRLYLSSSVIPKHHFMVHMPRLILK